MDYQRVMRDEDRETEIEHDEQMERIGGQIIAVMVAVVIGIVVVSMWMAQ